MYIRIPPCFVAYISRTVGCNLLEFYVVIMGSKIDSIDFMKLPSFYQKRFLSSTVVTLCCGRLIWLLQRTHTNNVLNVWKTQQQITDQCSLHIIKIWRRRILRISIWYLDIASFIYPYCNTINWIYDKNTIDLAHDFGLMGKMTNLLQKRVSQICGVLSVYPTLLC